MTPVQLAATNHVLMMTPESFDFSPETAQSNAFMRRPESLNRALVWAEFEGAVHMLRSRGVRVSVCRGQSEHVPEPLLDAVFPNNWFSTHASGRLVLYPMATLNRQRERRMDVVAKIIEISGTRDILDLSYLEPDHEALEGTGSIVLARDQQTAFISLSPRATQEAIQHWKRNMEFQVVSFSSVDPMGHCVYHTNVLMSVGLKIAIVCLDVIPDAQEKQRLAESLLALGREIIPINWRQAKDFCANALELLDSSGVPFWVLSTRAWSSLDHWQREKISTQSKPCIIDVSTIESVGGGGIRCMLAEIFSSHSLK